MLITIEGIDGSGKTTLADVLKSEFNDVFFTKEPTDGFEFSKLKPLEDKYSSLYNFFLFTSDRIEHQKEIKDNDNKMIISDRYISSSIAYEGPLIQRFFKNRDDTIIWMLDVSRFIAMPDLIIYLDVDIETALDRINSGRKNLTYNEKMLSKLEKKKGLIDVKEYYEYFFDNIEKFTGRNIKIIKINANDSMDEIIKKVKSIIKNL